MTTKIILILSFILGLCASAQSQTWTQFGSDINGESANDNFGRSVSLSSNGKIMAVGGYQHYDGAESSDQVRVYENQSGDWVQIGNDISEDNDGNDMGPKVVVLSSDGTTVAIGTPLGDVNNSEFSGYVTIYKNITGVWTQVGLTLSGQSLGIFFGESLSLSSDGSIVAIGANGCSAAWPYTGAVYIYENLAGNWTQVGSTIYGEFEDGWLGSAISLSSNGSIVAIGARRGSNTGPPLGEGAVFVYENLLGTWTQVGSTILGVTESANLGSAISLSSDGSIMAIGVRGDSTNGLSSGAVYIYENLAGNWTPIGTAIHGESNEDNFGMSVSLNSDGTILAIGACYSSENASASGSAGVYENQAGVWTQIGLSIEGELENDNLGFSLSLSSDGSIVAVGIIGVW